MHVTVSAHAIPSTVNVIPLRLNLRHTLKHTLRIEPDDRPARRISSVRTAPFGKRSAERKEHTAPAFVVDVRRDNEFRAFRDPAPVGDVSAISDQMLAPVKLSVRVNDDAPAA